MKVSTLLVMVPGAVLALLLGACSRKEPPVREGGMMAARPGKMMSAPELAPGMATETAVFGMGCFWGAEEHFYGRPGVLSTSVGYAGGTTEHPTYEQVSSHTTRHAESVKVVFDPSKVSYQQLLQIFWEQHDPTQGDRQGNDIGDSYRSAIYTFSAAQLNAAMATRDAYQAALARAGHGKITTEIAPAGPIWDAEPYHQQYCIRNPEGYCGHGGTGVSFPMADRTTTKH